MCSVLQVVTDAVRRAGSWLWKAGRPEQVTVVCFLAKCLVDGILSDSYPIGNGVKQGPGVGLVLVSLACASMFDRRQGWAAGFEREILVWEEDFFSLQ